MPEASPVPFSSSEIATDRKLIANCIFALIAAFVQIVVGYIVAHRITITADKRIGWITPVCCLLVALVTGLRSHSVFRTLQQEDDTEPRDGRRLFLARLALSLSAFAVLVILASSLILVTLRPND